MRFRPSLERTPPQAYFVCSAAFHYLGPAFAVLLFARVEPLGVAWLRALSAAVVLLLWRRPWRRSRRVDAAGRRLLLALGCVFALMNACFYLAIQSLPLGTVAAIEFVPVVALAALGARTMRNGAALLIAVAGVYLLSTVQLEAKPVPMGFAVANAALFAGYIVLGHRLSRAARLDRLDGLAIAMGVAAVVATPVGLWSAAPALLDPVALAAGIGVGVASSVVPYVLDQLAMARLPRPTYALMVSILPATATIVGIVVLRQLPTLLDLAGVALVVSAVALHRERATSASGVRRAQSVRHEARRVAQGPERGARNVERLEAHGAEVPSRP